MLPVTAATVRLFLHVLAATVWVGGQLTLGAIIPALRPAADDPDPEAARTRIRTVARRFQVVAWIAFAVLLVTGVWNLLALHVGDRSTEWLATLMAHLGCAAVSGIAAAVHILVTEGPGRPHAPDREGPAYGVTALPPWFWQPMTSLVSEKP